MEQTHKELILATWLRRLSDCQIPFENQVPIQPFEVMCVFDHVQQSHFYCPMLGSVNDDGNITLMTFIDPDLAPVCDFAYNAPAHWVEKIHRGNIRFVEDFMAFQSQKIINYITVFINQMLCFSEDFMLYHNKMSKDGPNDLVDQLVQIYEYICQMVGTFGVNDINQRLTVAITIIDSFFDFFEVPRQLELVFMANDRVRERHFQRLHESQTTFDTEIWGEIADIL